MQLTNPSRPRVSRETRQLLAIVVISLSALWVLARIRFPDRPVAPNPVPPVLAQLAPESAFDDMTSTLLQLHPRLSASLLALPVGGQPSDGRRTAVPALRIRPDVAVALIDDAHGADMVAGVRILARDPASQVAVLRVATETSAELTLWIPRRMAGPRFLVAAVAAAEGTSLRPVFVGSLYSAASPIWPDAIWTMPPETAIDPGTFVFTLDGSLVGLVVEHDAAPAIVPGEALLAAASRLLDSAPRSRGYVGVIVAPLTGGIASATGAQGGVVVTWVDPKGPAAGQLLATDVIETLNEHATTTPEHWRARASRLGAGDSVVLGIRRSGEVQTVRVTAAGLPAAAGTRPLGLTMRVVRRIGVEVIRVQAGSAAADAGIEAGDVLTRVGNIDAPSPTEVTKMFADASDGRPMLVALTRGGAHHVVAVRTQ
jgi:S1-C subfamily serine protease